MKMTVDLDKSSVLQTLQEHKAELQARGFAHVSLFGSTARGDVRPGSDIDLLVELDETKDIGLGYFATIRRLQEIFGRHVDVVTHPIRKASLKEAVERDRVNAF
jgi:hypothetical protein